MNHDYAHCADYDETTCPETCFRGQLVRDHRVNMIGIPVSWAHLAGTEECTKYRRKTTNADRIRAMTVEELAEYICINAPEACPTGICTGEDFCYKCWLDWLKQEVDDD